MNEAWIWARITAALDAREDPLEDAQIAAWLAEHDAERVAFARLRGRLADVERGAARLGAVREARPRRRVLLGLVAVAVLCGWFAVASRPGAARPGALVVHEYRTTLERFVAGPRPGAWTHTHDGCREERRVSADGTWTQTLHVQLGGRGDGRSEEAWIERSWESGVEPGVGAN